MVDDGGTFPRNLGIRAEGVGESSGLAVFPAGHSPLRISLWKRNARKYLKERCLELSDGMGHPEWFSSVLRHMSFGLVIKMMKSPVNDFPIMEAVRVLRDVVEEVERLRKEGALKPSGPEGKSRTLSSVKSIPSVKVMDRMQKRRVAGGIESA
ncbi:MAG: hypothetical protein M1297_08310 [Nitrospirae bacterium]|jgi:hypothetical protein|nr:hypothetical protein [Nitrospirota bacterium]